MGKRTHKTLVLLSMLQFLVWTQVSAARLVCQCDHSPQDNSCQISQVKAASADCCAVENAAAGSNESHEMLPSSPEKDHSCCSQQATEEQENKNINYSTLQQWCKSVCLNPEMVQTKQTVLPRTKGKTKGKTVDFALVSQPIFISTLPAAVPVPVKKNHVIHSNSPPIFLLHSAFLI